MQIQQKKGFTLVELLVVALIITLLAVVVIVGYNNSRVAARDARRKSDLTSLTSALRQYYIKNNGAYPPVTPSTSVYCQFSPGSACLDELVTGNFVDKLPSDPKSGRVYAYTLIAGSPDYIVLLASMEDPSDSTGGYKGSVPSFTCDTNSYTYCVKLQY